MKRTSLHRKRLIQAHRAAMAARQLGICPWCVKSIHEPLCGDETHIDHVVPVENPTGTHSTNGAARRAHYNSRTSFAEHGDNLRLMHAHCNLERGDSHQLTDVPF